MRIAALKSRVIAGYTKEKSGEFGKIGYVADG
jgi:hypothetical protein